MRSRLVGNIHAFSYEQQIKTMMDIKQLINLVHGYKCLWDQSDSNYYLRDHQRKSWRKISAQMKIPEDELKKKWRGLRDTFGRELKKVTQKRSGQVADTKPDSKWPYFKVLLFLRGTMSRRHPKGNTPETCEDMNSDRAYNINTSTGSDYLISPPTPSPDQASETLPKLFKSPLKKKINRQKTDEIDARLLEIEEEKLKYFQESANDPDTQFLMSLVPFLKDVPKHRKLSIRTKLQQVFVDEQNDMLSTVPLDYSSDSSQHSAHSSIPQHISKQGQSQQTNSDFQQQLSNEASLNIDIVKFDPDYE